MRKYSYDMFDCGYIFKHVYQSDFLFVLKYFASLCGNRRIWMEITKRYFIAEILNSYLLVL